MSSNTMKELFHFAQLASPHAQKISLDLDSIVSFQTVLTPALASRLIKENKGNRRMSQKHVDEIANAIKAGRWRPNGATIRISKSGRVVDGQHRIAAVLETGMAIEVTIVFGVDDDLETLATIDQEKQRSVIDILTISGVESDPVSRAAANMLSLLTAGESYRKDRPEQAEFLTRHSDEIDPWVEWASDISSMSPLIDNASRRYRGIAAATLVTLSVHLAREGVDTATWQEFISGGVGEIPISLMRTLSDNRLHLLKLVDRRLKHGHPLGRPGGGTQIIPLMQEFAVYIRQYNRYIRDEKLGKLIRTEEQFRYLNELPKVEQGGKW